MRRTGAVLVIANALIFLIGMLTVLSGSDVSGFVFVVIFIPSAIQVFCGVKGFLNDDSKLYGILSLIITVIFLFIGGMMVFQLILGLVGGILLLFPRKAN